MDCGVCIGGGDYELWDFCDSTMRKARKPHKCCECSREIPKGAQYEYIAGKCGGDFQDYKTCLDCMNIRNGLSCDSVALTGLWDDIYEIFPEVTTGCLQRIKTPSAKAYFIERWNQWKFRATA